MKTLTIIICTAFIITLIAYSEILTAVLAGRLSKGAPDFVARGVSETINSNDCRKNGGTWNYNKMKCIEGIK